MLVRMNRDGTNDATSSSVSEGRSSTRQKGNVVTNEYRISKLSLARVLGVGKQWWMLTQTTSALNTCGSLW